jgi:hypothetical protein
MHRRLTLLIALTFGCTDSGTTEGPSVLPTPVATREFGLDSLDPLEFAALVSWNADTVLAAERRSGDVWSVSRRDAEIEMGRVLGFPTPTRVVALARDGEDLLVLTQRLRLYRFPALSESEPHVIDLPLPPLAAVTSAIGLGGGSFALLMAGVDDGALSSKVLVIRPDARPPLVLSQSARYPTAGTAPRHDRVSLAIGRDSLYLSGTDPPRVSTWELASALRGELPSPDDSSAVASVTVPLEVRQRPVPNDLRRRVAPALRDAGLIGSSARLPDLLPTPMAVQPLAGGLMAVAITEHQDGDGRALDLYCHGRFRQTVLSSPDVVWIHLVDGLALVFRVVNPMNYRLEMHDLSIFEPACLDDG